MLDVCMFNLSTQAIYCCNCVNIDMQMISTVYISCWRCSVQCRIQIGWIWGKNSKICTTDPKKLAISEIFR